MLPRVARVLLAFVVVFAVALSPLGIDACLLSCQAPVNSAAHHACHGGEHGRAAQMASHVQTCLHDHSTVVETLTPANRMACAHSFAMNGAALHSSAENVNAAQIIRATSPPRHATALTAVAASALPLRV
jgi:hypothetical protein